MIPIPYLPRSSSDFPEALRLMPDPPEGLYYRATALQSLFTRPMVAIVGTRKMTAYGKSVIRDLVPSLARAGCVIVSGLALGCDGEAHAAALDAGGGTIAVLGGGIGNDDIYPRAHFGLGQRILENGGAIVSEFAPGTPSYKSHFPHRNRIIAGMCAATIVIEGEMKSGSMITGKLAAEFGRTVFAVPGPVRAPYSLGTNNLIQNGAFLYAEPRDVLEVLGLRESVETRVVQDLVAPEHQQLLGILAEPRDFDALLAASGLASSELMTQLTMLEIEGLIRRSGAMWVSTNM